TLTTMPLFANGLFRFDGDHPFTTSSPGLVAAGAMIPPGHMQNENTPFPSTCCTRLYDAGGRYAGRRFPFDTYAGALRWYCMLSISDCGCSTRTPNANGFDSIFTPF